MQLYQTIKRRCQTGPYCFRHVSCSWGTADGEAKGQVRGMGMGSLSVAMLCIYAEESLG